MSDDDYMKDPRAKSVEGFKAGLDILAKYMDEGQATKFAFGAEHDEIFVYVELEDCPADSDDGLELSRLGFHPSNAGNWGYFT